MNVINFIRQHGITDVLFASCAYTATGPNCKHFERIRTYGGGAAAPEQSSAAESSADESSSGGTVGGTVGATVGAGSN